MTKATTLTDLIVAVATTGGIIFTIATVTLGFVVRASFTLASLLQRVTVNESTIAANADNSAKAYNQLYDVIREDRRATNERLTYLERKRMESE